LGKRLFSTLFLIMALVLAACGGSEEAADAAEGDASGGEGVCATTDASGDLLAEICEEGTLTVSTDPAYPPQSSLNPDTNSYEGFDIDVATEIANRLGVEVAWEAPAWDTIIAGNWQGRWDVSVGSMSVTTERAEVLHFTQPYYYSFAVAVVHQDNTTVNDLATDLDGATIGVCGGCTYDVFLQKTLEIPGVEFDFAVDDAVITGYDTDTTALADLALGDGTRLDAVVTGQTVAEGSIEAGSPLKIAGDPLFFEPMSVAIDKSAPADPMSLLAAIDDILTEMHEDGTLSTFSEKWYEGADLTVGS
jgi:polar amino acid transport system substrate-binding protein